MLKRSVDIITSFFGLLILSPLLLIISLLLLLKQGSPIFHAQIRPGKDEKPFWMIKFRTMSNAKNSSGELLPDHKRLTAIGAFLRSTSLDELPELWNVLKGDMSLVGPRPLLMDYLSLYNDRQRRRHEVRPGITGWAQINGRNSISWQEKFDLDLYYIENQSLWLDFKILCLTLKKVILREGISAKGEATMPKFEGNHK